MVVIISESDPEAIQLLDENGNTKTLDVESGRVFEGVRVEGESWWSRNRIGRDFDRALVVVTGEKP